MTATIDAPEVLDAPESPLDQKPAYTLGDLIRLGSAQTEQAVGSWGDGKTQACALTAAYIGAKIVGLAK